MGKLAETYIETLNSHFVKTLLPAVLSDNEVQKVTAKRNLLLKHGGVTATAMCSSGFETQNFKY